MSNTPKTDQLEECDQYKVDEDYAEYNAYRRMVEHARHLERERDGYREQTDALVDRLGATQERMIDAERERDEASNALIIAVDEMVQAQSQLREAKREFDEARDTVATMEIRHAAAMFHAQRVVDDASQLREQRDKLADALRMITTFDYTDLQCDNGHGARSVATEALQSLTTTEP